MSILTEAELADFRHQQGNEIFGAKLAIKNLKHLLTTSQASEKEKEQCQKLLSAVQLKLDNLQAMQEKLTIK